MKILIDIGHPGHVHYFKNTIKHLKNNNHDVLIIARDREVIKALLHKLKFPFISRGKGKNSRIGKFLYMVQANFLMLKVALKFKPDLFLSFSSPYVAQVSSLLGKPNIALNDTEHTDRIHSKFTYPFSTAILTPSSYQNDLGIKQIRFNSVIENLYLHKQYFMPNIKIKEDLQLKENEEFAILRFVSWNAHHDYGQKGLDVETKRGLINILETKKYRVLISSEGELAPEFKKYQIKISPEKMHDVLASASIFIGESATMASESAILGTQAVYINSLPLMCYLKLEQEAGLLKHFKSSVGVLDYVSKLIEDSNLKQSAKEKSEIMQKDFINPTSFLIWFLENYPESVKIMKDTPEYQNRFK